MVYTIIEGNDKELFWINSTSGELFLVAPLTAIAEDSIVLVVKPQNAVPVNSSSQDTTHARVWFYGGCRLRYSCFVLIFVFLNSAFRYQSLF